MLEKFTPVALGPKDWGTELLVAHTPHYTGKIMHMRAGASGPLQYHEQKDETFYLYSGVAHVTTDEQGALVTVEMQPGESYHITPGVVHRVTAVSDCVFFEASTPHFEDRVNVDDRYK
jgi:mannose-6-phosphate isomerase